MRAMAIQRPRTAAAQARQARAAAAAAATARRAGVQPKRATAGEAAAAAAAAMAAAMPRLWRAMAAAVQHRVVRLPAEVLTPQRQRWRAAIPSRSERCSSQSIVCRGAGVPPGCLTCSIPVAPTDGFIRRQDQLAASPTAADDGVLLVL